mmetsp:Transcript_24641/g.67689  ORF Transcript_24641/g.67689 Transcript_24641/m.67689 type:complete len:112 (-) Transcript_24641:138-473(-)
MVVLGHRPLALENLDVHGWLVVLVGRKDLRLFRWDNCVPADELCHDAAHGLDAERQRSHIQEQQVLATLAAEDACLHGCSIRHSLIGIDATVRLLAIEEVLDELLDLRNAR